MLRADADADQVRANPAGKFRTFQEPDKPREPCRARVQEATPSLFPDQLLHTLRELGGERTAALYFRDNVGADGAFAKGSCQNIGRRDGGSSPLPQYPIANCCQNGALYGCPKNL